MQQVNVTELRNNLPLYMNQVKKGVEFLVTNHGESIARLVPEISNRKKAHNRLMQLQGTMIKRDIVEPVEAEWNADADNL